ncbi:RNHCP domain-containing protein [Streptomyces sp. BHT-5-2]|uniref:RNHCP domain-containing protein n=1 Tax=unclassified Streptomyces TaxID=2593676 RepID=UPI001C8DFD6C|nr:RNHCP domain-containing protein [Streptomyces sp. BHT-5-2]QZL02794.1 RNHCP domain-containing protein [Streptomyces sp. BHT-5-2]
MPRRTNAPDRARTRRPQRHKSVLRERNRDRNRGDHRADAFRCAGCRLDVPTTAPGTAHRNHCPNCLTSRHLDDRIPGDRAADCRGRMEAVAMSVRPDGEWLLIHQCLTCARLGANRIAGDDNPLALVHLALKPLRDPTFPTRALLAL